MISLCRRAHQTATHGNVLFTRRRFFVRANDSSLSTAVRTRGRFKKLFARKKFACLNVNFADGFSGEGVELARWDRGRRIYYIVVDFALAGLYIFFMLLYYYIMILFPTAISL